jgi:hypothetical protein
MPDTPDPAAEVPRADHQAVRRMEGNRKTIIGRKRNFIQRVTGQRLVRAIRRRPHGASWMTTAGKH